LGREGAPRQERAARVSVARLPAAAPSINFVAADEVAWTWLARRTLTRRAARARGGVCAMNLTNENLLVIIVVGIVAGWLAGQLVRGHGFGLIGDLVVGVIGAFVGSWLLPAVHIVLGAGIINEIINATIGAIILLIILRLVRGGGVFRR
jgi:uncharacterized membrane protein YeaQ/YmgE (transglycosylase-associated protein family)